ncbi:MAG: hypothetical protein M1828_002425 [Chrysothrix sp. TS-e1954]|nr:MAG: hypothetical protein M1828_002425 [Chrysothrix sp. TS-e1954]
MSKPTKSVLSAGFSTNHTLSRAGPQLHRASPLALRLPSYFPSSRQFSNVAALRPFALRSYNRGLVSGIAQSRSFGTGQTSHNLLAHLELTAHNNPSSASSQNAFYTALLRANMPSILVERYETGRYATNAACDAMYHRALERMSQSSSSEAMSSENYDSGMQRGSTQQQLRDVARSVVAPMRGGNQVASTSAGETGDRTNPLHVTVGETRGAYLFKMFKFIVGYAFFAYVILILVQFAGEASGVMKRVGGSNNAEVKPEQQTARFDDVKGCDEAKDELREVVDFLRSPDKYNQLGGKLPKGVLMIGPPGTGKTLLARAVAGEAGVPFFYMSGSEFDEVYVGVGAKRVRELFTNAKAKAPAIVFIDELDAVGGKRNERDASYHMQTLNQMLTELDGFDQTSGVVFIAATNFPQMLDKALTRPGRFDRQIQVSLPDVRGRLDIINHYLQKMKVSADIDRQAIARGTPGFSGADLENLVNQAAVHASKEGAKDVAMYNLDWAKDRVMMGAEKKSMVVQESEKLMTAYHEAGHTIVSMFTSGCDPLYKVTIMPRGHALGITFSLPDMDVHSQTKKQLHGFLDLAMGGKMAEEIVYGPDMVTSGCSSDLQNATGQAYEMVATYGMSDALGSVGFDNKMYRELSGTMKDKIDSEVRKKLDEALERARTLLLSKRKELDLLAEALMKYETLTKAEVELVIQGKPLPDKLPSLSGARIKLPDAPVTSDTGGQTDQPGGAADGPSTVPEPAGS